MNPLYRMLYPYISLMDPEAAHGLTIWALERGLAGVLFNERGNDDPILKSEVFGLSFSNPVGLAAGFDKNAQVVDAVLRLGFGFSEAGTVTPLPQPGNPKPRLFRLADDKAVINRFGFNSKGLAPFRKQLQKRQRRSAAKGIVGANLGANKESSDRPGDYVKGLEALDGLADYFTINVSSPNTPGLRGLQDRGELVDLIDQVQGVGVAAPMLLKIAPDVSNEDLEDICAVVLEKKMDGLIISNTTLSRPEELLSGQKEEAGGLSGAPLFDLSTERLGRAYELTDGKIPLVGAGGISNGQQAYEKILNGASLVQFYSALVYQGPALVQQIKLELGTCLRGDGFSSVSDAIGQKKK
jgi:dihydroorotate dehydrogenase